MVSHSIEVNLQPIKVLNKRIPFYRVIRLRERNLFTKNSKLRLRYVTGGTAIASMMLASLIGSTGTSIAYAPPSAEIAYADNITDLQNGANLTSMIIPSDVMDYNHEEIDDIATLTSTQPYNSDNSINTTLKPDFLPIKDPALNDRVIKIKKGSTIAATLQDNGISGAEAYRIVKSMSKHYDPRSIKAGQELSIHINPSEGNIELTSLNMRINSIKDLVISREDNGDFSTVINEKEITLHVNAGKTSINTSLSGSAARDGIPSSIVGKLMKIYSYNVDFQRDIRKGDKVEVLYETYETEDGDIAKYGDIIYANLMVGGKDNAVYRHKAKDGSTDFYRNSGESLKRILMLTPVDGARMSSGYGMRRHPVLGYGKMHKGIDFAASRGTPIYAAGDGVIERANRFGSYGNYVKIRHNKSLKTAYAHMKKFAKGIKAGTRVKQGQLIGYVGTTGRSTGPHLHFEVLKHNKQVNPKSVNGSSGKKLTGTKLANFKKKISEIKQQYAALAGSLKFAQNSVSE